MTSPYRTLCIAEMSTDRTKLFSIVMILYCRASVIGTKVDVCYQIVLNLVLASTIRTELLSTAIGGMRYLHE